jgi:hypothetical protein
VIRIEAARKSDSHLPFSRALGSPDQIDPRAKTRHLDVVRHRIAHEVILRDSQLVAERISFLGAAKLLLPAVLKLWLFEPGV